MNAKHTQQELADALRVLIKSGSANGNEAMRVDCLKLVNVLASGPDLLEALQEILEWCPTTKENETPFQIASNKARAAISRATQN